MGLQSWTVGSVSEGVDCHPLVTKEVQQLDSELKEGKREKERLATSLNDYEVTLKRV